MQMDNSSTCKGFSYSANSGESPEESSWTFYFQDFKSNNNNCSEQTSFCSDAASLAPYELITNRNNIGTLDINDNENNNKKFVGSKKRKMKGAAKVDDDLEDTASSPVNSPKVSYMDQFCNSQKGKSTASIIEGRGNNSGQQMMTSGLNISTNGNNDRTELKKKGLCLVPISMFRK